MRNPYTIAKIFILFGRIVRNPDYLDDIISISRTIRKAAGPKELKDVVEDFGSHPIGQSALESKHRAGKLNVQELKLLPEDTLGGVIGRFLSVRGLNPDDIPGVGTKTDSDYVLTHLYETHDIWHVITGFDTDPAGEVGLQAFYLAQTRTFLPLFIIAAIMLNTAMYAYDEKSKRMDAIISGWLLGKKAKHIAGYDWKANFHRPLAEVKAELSLC